MATYAQTATYYANLRTRKLRELLRRDYGAGKYRLTKTGEVHAYGTMRNTNQIGWYLLGYRRDVENEYQMW
jgi:hypothetical protein